LIKSWVPHDVRDQVVDFVRRWSEKTEISVGRFPQWLGIRASKFYDWRQRYGRVNEHNGWIPRDFWLESWEKEAIIGFHGKNPLEGYRRLTFMMLDAEVVAVSPAAHCTDSRKYPRGIQSFPGKRMASVAAGGATVAMERQALAQRDWV